MTANIILGEPAFWIFGILIIGAWFAVLVFIWRSLKHEADISSITETERQAYMAEREAS